VFSVDNMNASVSRRESLNGAAEPGRDLLEIDVFQGTKSVRSKNRCDASRLETADRRFINFLKLFGPLLSNCLSSSENASGGSTLSNTTSEFWIDDMESRVRPITSCLVHGKFTCNAWRGRLVGSTTWVECGGTCVTRKVWGGPADLEEFTVIG